MTTSVETAEPVRIEVTLTGILGRALKEARRDQVAVGDLLDAFGRASFVPLLLIPSLAIVSPLSGIPAFSSLCGLLIVLISVQWAFGRDHVWLPGWLLRRTIRGQRLRRGLHMLRPAARWLDRHTRTRLAFLFRVPLRWLPPAVCALFGSMIPLLELVPFSASLLGAAVALLSFSMLVRDGLLAVLAMLPAVAVVWTVVAIVSG